jgi:type 1 glutamine amidotransferase
MKNISLFLIFILLPLMMMADNGQRVKPRILVFSKTQGFRHSAIPNGKAAIIKLGKENGFDTDTTENSNVFNDDTLKKYAAVVFLQTTGNILDEKQKASFEKYIRSGGGFAGIHAASDTEYSWAWYGKLVGAYFVSHPAQQMATLNVTDRSHRSTKHLPAVWKRKDEWYNFKEISSDIKVLITIDEKSYKGGINGNKHPMAWYHEYDGGRAWYTELGHTEESYTEKNYLKHLLGGIQYAIRGN